MCVINNLFVPHPPLTRTGTLQSSLHGGPLSPSNHQKTLSNRQHWHGTDHSTDSDPCAYSPTPFQNEL
ncbi:hypothetical protein BDB00DRAFT_805291, partial [Zychaea mexicana]|uniref:uncharacterized protein n=1 Tax=Zychaea mexicana TaxID=64656 RepID=UPI0022FE9C54